MNKQGTAVRVWASAAALLTSLLIQYGAPVAEVTDALRGITSEPEHVVEVDGHPRITRCTGILDFIAKLLEDEAVNRAG